MKTRQRFCIAAVLAGSMTFAGSMQAGTIIIPSIERGHIEDDGTSIGNSNYITGFYVSPNYMSPLTHEWRSFFIFDLSAVPDEATSAVFRVYNPLDGYVGPDTFETLELNPIDKHPITAFGGTSPGTAAFDDLGGDSVDPRAPYASTDILDSDIGVYINIPLSGQALWDINVVINNSPLGYFGFGGKLTTMGGSDAYDEEKVFAHSGGGPGDTVLILSGPKIPEPATLSLVTLGGLALMRRKRK